MELDELLPSLSLQSSWVLPDRRWGVFCSISFVHFYDFGGAKLGCGKESGLPGSGFDVSYVVFLGELVYRCRNWATIVPLKF